MTAPRPGDTITAACLDLEAALDAVGWDLPPTVCLFVWTEQGDGISPVPLLELTEAMNRERLPYLVMRRLARLLDSGVRPFTPELNRRICGTGFIFEAWEAESRFGDVARVDQLAEAAARGEVHQQRDKIEIRAAIACDDEQNMYMIRRPRGGEVAVVAAPGTVPQGSAAHSMYLVESDIGDAVSDFTRAIIRSQQ